MPVAPPTFSIAVVEPAWTPPAASAPPVRFTRASVSQTRPADEKSLQTQVVGVDTAPMAAPMMAAPMAAAPMMMGATSSTADASMAMGGANVTVTVQTPQMAMNPQMNMTVAPTMPQ